MVCSLVKSGWGALSHWDEFAPLEDGGGLKGKRVQLRWAL